MLSVILVILILTTLGLLWLRSRRGKLPPGPKRVPLLGSLPYIKFTHGLSDFFLNESITQHKIATLDMGPMRQFVINDFELAKVRTCNIFQFSLTLILLTLMSTGVIFKRRIFWTALGQLSCRESILQ